MACTLPAKPPRRIIRIMSWPGVFGRALAPTKAIERGARRGCRALNAGDPRVICETRAPVSAQEELVPLRLIGLGIESGLLLVDDDHALALLRQSPHPPLLLP